MKPVSETNEQFPKYVARNTITAGGQRRVHLEPLNERLIIVNGSSDCGCDDSDDEDPFAEPFTRVLLPSHPQFNGEDHTVIVGSGATALVSGGGCFDVCGGDRLVVGCSSLIFFWVPNKVDGCCGCGSHGCSCQAGSWVASDPSSTVDAVGTLADLTALDNTDFLAGTTVAVAAVRGGSLYVLDLSTTAGINGTTIVATATGVGRWILVEPTSDVYLALLLAGLINFPV